MKKQLTVVEFKNNLIAEFQWQKKELMLFGNKEQVQMIDETIAIIKKIYKGN